MELFEQMQQEGMSPNSFTFVQVLNACSSSQALEKGRCVHKQIIQGGFESDVFMGNSLIDMYAKCGSIQDAQLVFNRMTTRNVVSWNSMILGHVKCGQGLQALKLSQQMQVEGVQPDPVTFVGLLNACASITAHEEGRCVHEQITQSGCEFDVFVGTSLIDMYTKCGGIEDAQRVFNRMATCNVVSWNAMILGLVKCGQAHRTLGLSGQIQREGVQPDSVTFVGMLNACATLGALEEGRHIHEQSVQNGCESDIFVGSSLFDMYAKCGVTEDAQRVFKWMKTCNVVSWNAMILGHVKHGHGQRALELSQQMHHEGVEADPGTFVGVLNACASVGALEEGRCVHEQIIQHGFESDTFVDGSLADMYDKRGAL
jgi:pentatricopeptide repeat protein